MMEINDFPLKDKTVLVTGGGGFLGKAIVRRLLQEKADVRSFSRKAYSELESLGVEQFRGDIRDAKAVNKACEGVEVVFHVAAKIQLWGDYRDFFKTNVIGTENVIQACRKREIHQLVYTSSPSVIHHGREDVLGVDESAPYPEHYPSYYQKSKSLAEQRIVKASNNSLQTVALRPQLVLGPGDTQLIPRLIKWSKNLRIIGDGKNLVDWTFLDNAAYAHVLAAEKLMMNQGIAGKVFFISQGQPIGLWELVNHILESAGKEPINKKFPKDAAYFLGWLFEVVYSCFRIKSEPRMTRGLATALAMNSWFDISAARTELGYAPEVTSEEGLKKIKTWLEENQYATN
jgi:nucleoside-diphosphate-sugar epimerase